MRYPGFLTTSIESDSRRRVLIIHRGLVYVKSHGGRPEVGEGAEAFTGSGGCWALLEAPRGLECQEESPGVNRNKAAQGMAGAQTPPSAEALRSLRSRS